MMVRATPSWSLSYSVMASAASRSSDSALIMAMPWPAACSMGMSLMLSPNAQASARRSPRCSHNHVRAVPLGGALTHDLDIHGVRTRDLNASERVELCCDGVAIGRVVPVHSDAFERLDLVDFAVDIHVDRRSCALERSRDVGVAATELIQTPV